MRKTASVKQPTKKNRTMAPHVTVDTRDYGLTPRNLRHNPSSGFEYSEAERYRDDRSVNPNVHYVPGENNRDEMRQWEDASARAQNPRHTPVSAKSRSRAERRPDDYIYGYVYEILSKHPDIDVSQIEMDVREGIVILHGLVETRRMKRLIEDVVFGLPGIHDVQNRIEVLRPDPDRRRIAHSLA